MAGKLAKILGIFDKIDDIVYEPVHALSGWITEPLKISQAKRDRKTAENASKLKARELSEQAKIEDFNRRSAAELEIIIRRENAEIDNMIVEQEDARRDKLVEALKQYQLTLAKAAKEIGESIGHMSVDLMQKAYDMESEKINEYKEWQRNARDDSIKQLKEAKDEFGEDSKIFEKLSETILAERSSAIKQAESFIESLRNDIKRLIENIDTITNKNIDFANEALRPLSNALGASYEADRHSIEKKGF